jgi:hypothetical protein
MLLPKVPIYYRPIYSYLCLLRGGAVTVRLRPACGGRECASALSAPLWP